RRSGFLDLAALKAELIGAARALGFDVAGVVRPDAIPLAASRLQEFLAAGAHGDMAWMAANADRRGDPRTLWSEVRSILMLGINYGPDRDPLAVLRNRNRGGIFVYLRGDDYRHLIKSRLQQLSRRLLGLARSA